MTKTIEIIVASDGTTSVQTKGFSGANCRDASAFLEKAIGQQESEQLTAEFYQPQQGHVDQPLEPSMKPPALPQIVLIVSGGVLQQVYCDLPELQAVVVDFDCEGRDLEDSGVVAYLDTRGRQRLAEVGLLPITPLGDLRGTAAAAALEAGGLGFASDPLRPPGAIPASNSTPNLPEQPREHIA